MKLQEFLRQGGTTIQLLDQYAIATKWHPKYPNLAQFSYDMIESPMGLRIVQEARGVIMDLADGWNVVARPFDKFFNYGEGQAAEINWTTARVQEKVDGSLLLLYYHRGEWLVATRGTPDAGGQVNGFDFNFAQLFWKTWEKMGLSFPDYRFDGDAWKHQDLCYMFELTSPYNRVVVQHLEPKLTLIGVRHRSGVELPVNLFRDHYPVVRSFPLQTMDDLLETFKTMSPTDQEGYVVVDAYFHRVKIKNPAYVAIHHMKDGFGIRRLVELIQTNETSEFLTYFPEWKGAYEEVKGRYDRLVVELEDAYDRIKGLTDQKAFALEAVKTRHSASLFMIRKGTVKSIRQSLAGMHSDTMIDLLKARDVKLNIESVA